MWLVYRGTYKLPKVCRSQRRLIVRQLQLDQSAFGRPFLAHRPAPGPGGATGHLQGRERVEAFGHVGDRPVKGDREQRSGRPARPKYNLRASGEAQTGLQSQAGRSGSETRL